MWILNFPEQYSVTGFRHILPAKFEILSARAQSHPGVVDVVVVVVVVVVSAAGAAVSSSRRLLWHLRSNGTSSSTVYWQLVPVNPDGHLQVSINIPLWALRESSSAVARTNRQYPPLAHSNSQVENFQKDDDDSSIVSPAPATTAPAPAPAPVTTVIATTNKTGRHLKIDNIACY